MTYNIHPLFVHFPIALLLLYSVVKILPLKKWFPNTFWKNTEILLLVTGVIGAFVASSTGENAERLVHPVKALASLSTWIYGALLAGELLDILNKTFIPKLKLSWLTKFSIGLANFLTNRFLSIVLAILGLITISVTGLLGGVMVYGVSADPIAPNVLKLLGISL
jgi:uncharacterized membrane protein